MYEVAYPTHHPALVVRQGGERSRGVLLFRIPGFQNHEHDDLEQYPLGRLRSPLVYRMGTAVYGYLCGAVFQVQSFDLVYR
jgi:hypothetical protein